jgi:sarcosine oxidase
VLRARRAVQALVERALGNGARLLTGSARPEGDAVVVGGRRLEADRVVWACGAWLAGLFPGLVALRITQQDTLFLRAPQRWRTPPVPAWIDAANLVYGWGDLDGAGAKVACDQPGPEFDPDGERTPSANAERSARAYLARSLPALATAPLRGTEVCQYASTPDADFIADRHPQHEHVWILGGGSGHGFKHGPALAERMAVWLAGAAEPELRFALGRPAPPDGERRGAIAYRAAISRTGTETPGHRE